MVSLLLISREVPALVWSPVVGVAADFVDRKKIMIAADILRALVVLGYVSFTWKFQHFYLINDQLMIPFSDIVDLWPKSTISVKKLVSSVENLGDQLQHSTY